MSPTGLLAALLHVVLTVTGVPVPVADAGARVAAPPSVDGTQPAAATGFGSVPPAWLGTRLLPDDPSTGYGEVRPTPPVMRHRRWTLPDDVLEVAGPRLSDDATILVIDWRGGHGRDRDSRAGADRH